MSTKALINGKIYIRPHEFCSALLIEEGTIKKIGTDQEIRAHTPDSIEDLQKRLVLPGFIDSHLHLGLLGEQLCDVDLHSCRSIAEIQKAIQDYIMLHDCNEGTIVHGLGWNQDNLEEKRMLHKKDLDQVSTTIPIIMERVCTHIACVNSALLEKVEQSEIEGGRIDRETGIVEENACRLFLQEKTSQQWEEQLRKAIDHCISFGITSVGTADLKTHNYEYLLPIFEKIQKDEKIRIQHQYNIEEPEALDRFSAFPFTPTPFHSLGPIKAFMDGSLGARTAWLSSPYIDDRTTSGYPIMAQDDLERLVAYAKIHQKQIIIHAIGDRAIENVLEVYARYQEPDNPLRWGIVHVQITDPRLLDRMRTQNILALIQPVFLEYDLHIVEDRVGSDRAKSSYAFKTLEKTGVSLSLGTDAPVEKVDPLCNLHCATKRQDYQHFPAEGFHPEEALSLEEAIEAYTQGSAYAQNQEKLGRIAPGYWADLVVFDQDLFQTDDLLVCRVYKTMVNGKWVYRRKVSE